MPKTQVISLSWEDTLKKGTATHSSILAWRIPWTEEPGQLPSIILYDPGITLLICYYLLLLFSC